MSTFFLTLGATTIQSISIQLISNDQLYTILDKPFVDVYDIYETHYILIFAI